MPGERVRQQGTVQKGKQWGLLFLVLVFAANGWAKPLSESIDYSIYEQGLDYSGIKLPGVDDEGYTAFAGENVSLKWKVDVYLPEDGPVFGLQPVNPNAIIRLRIKDIKGDFQLSGIADWEELGSFEREKEWRVGTAGVLEKPYFIRDVNEVVAYRKHGIISFLGNTLASPPLYIDRINGTTMMTYTMYVPKTRKILGVYKGVRTFRLGEYSYFFVKNVHVAGIIYIDERLKLLVHAGLSLAVLFLVAVILKFYDKIPRFAFQSKHLLLIVLLSWFLMNQLAFVVPNPNGIVYIVEGNAIKYGGASVQHYLRLITGLTNSVDALVINDDAWCWPDIFETDRNLYLLTKSVEKVYMRESLYNAGNPCIEESKLYFGSKLQVIPDDEKSLKEALARHKHQYPWKAAWGISRRIIYLLFLIISFFSTGFVVLRAFEIRTPKDWVVFAAIGFLYATLIQFFNLTTAFVARMPVTYHGTSSLPLTMSAKVLPFFNQAHNIRMGILLLGVLFVFVFTASVRERISVRAFLLPVLLLGLLLAAPQTEYSTKSFIIAFACGGCGFTYQGTLDTFNAVKLYSALRGDKELEVMVGVDDVEAYNRASLLQEQGNREGAIDLYEEYIVSYPNAPRYIEALKALASLNNDLGRYTNAERYLTATLENDLGDYGRSELASMLRFIYLQTGRTEQALKLMREQADLITDEPVKGLVLTKLGIDYSQHGKPAEAKKTFNEILTLVDVREEDAAVARAGLKRIAEEEHS